MWTVVIHPELKGELDALPREAAKKLAECLLALAQLGPQLGRPLVDTLKGSRFVNMKELRFTADGVWRFAFAFDPKRRAVVLAAMDKRGRDQARAYADLIATADRRFVGHQNRLDREKEAMKRTDEYLTLDDFMRRFSAKERAEIEANARKLTTEMMTFAKLRKARNLTQVEMARLLGIAQENVSRLEHRSDVLISTMRNYVRAMGGDLRLLALFPDQEPVEVAFQDLREPSPVPEKRKPRRTAAPRKSRRKVKKGKEAA